MQTCAYVYTKIIKIRSFGEVTDLKVWNYDGSSTGQAGCCGLEEPFGFQELGKGALRIAICLFSWFGCLVRFQVEFCADSRKLFGKLLFSLLLPVFVHA